MTTLLGDARVRIRPDLTGFQQDVETGIGGSFKKVAGLAAGALAAAGVGSFLKDTIDKASDLNETISKANNIFGANSKTIQAWSKNAATSLGLSRSAALDAAANFGNMFQQLGFAGDQATKMSTNTVKLAADLGSFNNLSTDDVLDRISGAMRGEYDSLQLLIPNISAARVEAEAMAETGKKNADSLTAQDKATATLAIVQKDGAAAQNDFAETSSGLANSTKIAGAEFDDLKTKIGNAFLPAAKTAMGWVSDTGIPALSTMTDTITTKVVPAIQGFSDNAKDAFNNYAPDIDLSAIVQKIKDKAADTGKALLDGIKTGLDSGDWAPLGSTIGTGISTALNHMGDLASKFGTFLKDMVSKVNWGDLAMEFGKQAPTLALGLITGLLNLDFGSLIHFVMDHWLEVLLGVITIVFAPAKFLGPIAELLGRIPFAGQLIEWGLKAMNEFGGKIVGWVSEHFFGPMKEGFTAGGPGLLAKIGDLWETIKTWTFVKWDDLVQGVTGKVEGLGRNLGTGFRSIYDTVTGKIGEAIGWVLDQFGRLGGWVWDKIVAAVGTIRDGVTRFTQPIKDMAGDLYNKGKDAVGKLIDGIKSLDLAATGRTLLDNLGSGLLDFGTKVKSWAGSIKDKIVGEIKDLFGIHSPSRVMAELGGHMVSGLLKGLTDGKGAIKAVTQEVFGNTTSKVLGKIGGVGSAIASIFGGGGKGGGGGTSQWAGIVSEALALTGQPQSLLQTTLRRMNQESGGNAKAINLWDSNAKKGIPSKGLMQVIDPTFRAYAMPGLNSNIYDPLSNVVASMRYAISRYGSLSAAYNKSGGYDDGGVAMGVGALQKFTLKPERVLSPRQTEAFERWMDGDTQAAGSSSSVVNVYVQAVPDGEYVRTQARIEIDRTATQVSNGRR